MTTDDELVALSREAIQDLARRMAYWASHLPACDLSRGLETLSDEWFGLAEGLRVSNEH